MYLTLTLAQLPPSLRQQIRLNDREREVTACWEWTGPVQAHPGHVQALCVLTETNASEDAAAVVWAAMHQTSICCVPHLRPHPTCEPLCVSPYHFNHGHI